MLKDNNIYLGTQLPKADNSGYYGIIADNDCILVGKYDNNYQNANIIVYKQRKSNLKVKWNYGNVELIL